jgi:hypothetical protein
MQFVERNTVGDCNDDDDYSRTNIKTITGTGYIDQPNSMRGTIGAGFGDGQSTCAGTDDANFYRRDATARISYGQEYFVDDGQFGGPYSGDEELYLRMANRFRVGKEYDPCSTTHRPEKAWSIAPTVDTPRLYLGFQFNNHTTGIQIFSVGTILDEEDPCWRFLDTSINATRNFFWSSPDYSDVYENATLNVSMDQSVNFDTLTLYEEEP